MLRALNKYFRKFRPFDRRRHKRFQPSQLIKCLCIYTRSGQQIEIQTQVYNISKAGLLMMTGQNKIYPQTELELRFQLDSKQTPISIYGQIQRTYRHHMESWYYSAVRFKEHQEALIQLLLDFALGNS